MKKLLVCLIFALTFCTACYRHDDVPTIKFASWGSQSEVAILKPLIEDFEQKNGVKVEFMHIPQNYFQKLHLLFASNMPPDVIFINNLYLPVYADFLEDLTLYADKEVFYKKSLDAMTYENKVLAIPRDVSNLVVYYNKDLFDKYGISYPNKNWTFKDLLEKSLEFKKHGVFGISFETSNLFYLPYLMSEGGGILSEDLRTVIIDKPQSQKGLQFYADLRNKYNVAPKKSQSASATMAQMFLQKQIAMHLSGRWLVPKYREVADFNWDIINFPNGDKGSIVPMDASGWAVCKQSKRKELALKFVQYLSSKDSIEKLTKSGLITPARIDVANSDIFLKGKPQSTQVFLEVIETSKPTPVSKDYREISDKIDTKLELLFEK